MSYSPSINLIIHSCAFLIYGYAIYWQEMQMKPIPLKTPQSGFAGRWKYLTQWNLIIQFVFFTSCLICDLLPRNQSSVWKTCRKVRDCMFHGLAFPTALYVSIVFWSLYAIDRELVFPRGLELYYPNWLNHTVHTLIVPLIVMESALNYHVIPSKKVGLTILNVLVVSYGLWTFYMALVIKLWVYPVMEVMNWPSRILFISVGSVFFTILYFVGNQLHRKLWRDK